MIPFEISEATVVVLAPVSRSPQAITLPVGRRAAKAEAVDSIFTTLDKISRSRELSTPPNKGSPHAVTMVVVLRGIDRIIANARSLL
mmetsp:Transcript_34007/g.54757  ORF Transcript_34007/g.54757 Transcript_34007/m.54757 type:complete len:87 (-) Transcript_34007:153-413(-)